MTPNEIIEHVKFDNHTGQMIRSPRPIHLWITYEIEYCVPAVKNAQKYPHRIGKCVPSVREEERLRKRRAIYFPKSIYSYCKFLLLGVAREGRD